MASTEQNFFYNSMLARALVQLIPVNQRTPLRLWFDKLLTLNQTTAERDMRNEYMWFILLMLQCQKIREPFDRPPPAEIQPVRDLVSPKIYEEILVSNDDNMSWTDNIDLNKTDEEDKDKYKVSAPSQFFESQPFPHEGVVCYLAVFSDQGDGCM